MHSKKNRARLAVFRKKVVHLHRQSVKKDAVMETTKTYKQRTREEVMAWLQRARERKQAWEEQTQLELKVMADEARRAKESHYFDFAG